MKACFKTSIIILLALLHLLHSTCLFWFFLGVPSLSFITVMVHLLCDMIRFLGSYCLGLVAIDCVMAFGLFFAASGLMF